MESSNDIKDKILLFEIDEKANDLSFVDRLAIENNWSFKYAAACFDEYKKFIYLSCISESPITPSDEVDQVWHLHLSYTKSYWQILCKQVLNKELHHCPTQGGQAEDEKYKRQYKHTLALYEKVFDHKAPSTIWPSPQKRFQSINNFFRINSSDYWLVKKPSRRMAVPMLASVILVACSSGLSDFDIALALKWIFGIVFCYVLISWIKSVFGGGKGGGGACGGGSGCGGCGGG